jgi:hypothetical protein
MGQMRHMGTTETHLSHASHLSDKTHNSHLVVDAILTIN